MNKRLAPFLTSALALLALPAAARADGLDTGDTALVLVSAGLVMLMTPGLAFFYGGLVRSKNVVHTMNLSIVVMGVAGVLWALIGYSLAFSPGGGLDSVLGGLSWALLRGVGDAPDPTLAATIPHSAFMLFQGMFAVITPALISGALVERVRIKAYLLFIALWCLFVYAPVAHWVWAPGGWLRGLGVLDFAGGTVVHINAAAAALVGALLLGKRRGLRTPTVMPHNVPFAVLGMGLLWFGWLGFNGGSALAANGTAGMTMLATHLGAAAGSLTWMFCEWIRFGKPSVLGIVTGMVAGLGTITPASGFVGPLGGLVIGVSAGLVCFTATNYMKRSLHVDDSLDVFPVHGVGGILGTTLTGVFAATTLGGVGFAEGMTMGKQVMTQITGVLVTAVWSGAVSYLLLKLIDAMVGLRVSIEHETEGLDTVLHNETGYNL